LHKSKSCFWILYSGLNLNSKLLYVACLG
jgi:hypothetical protein